MRVRASVGVVAVGVTLGMTVALTGCATATDGTGTGVTSPSAAPSAFPATSSPGPSAATAPVLAASQLPLQLMRPPAGSRPWSNSWGEVATPTLNQYLARFYDAQYRASESKILHERGLEKIAHRTWIAGDEVQADVILLCFPSASQALRHYTDQARAEGDSTGVRAVSLLGVLNAFGFVFPGSDASGYSHAVFFAQARNVTVELWYYQPGRYRAADAARWLKAQLAILND